MTTKRLAQFAEQMPDDETVVLSASFAQQRLWFLDQYEPGTGTYNLPAAWRIEGLLDRVALERGLNEVVRRHEAVRTTFATEHEAPVQIIAGKLQVPLSLVDLSLATDATAQAQRWIVAEANQPFDLARGPLIRSTLIKLAEDQHILLITLHHIIADGWSLDVLVHELSVLYGAFRSGQPSPLTDLSIQYGDFAIWQRERLQGAVLQEHLSYWRRYLEDASPVLELPTDHPRPPTLAHDGAGVEFEVSRELSAELRDFSLRSQVTLFMTLATAFNVLLYRYSQHEDICIGYPVANRNRAEIEGLIGFFVNTLVLRTRLSPVQSFTSVLKHVRDSVLDADAHQDLPFEKLIEELRPARNLSHSPLFQVMLAFNNPVTAALEFPGLSVQPVEIDSTTAKFELTLRLVEHKGQMHGVFEYNTALFDRATIERMAGHYRTLLAAAVASPQAAIADLPLLTQAERHQLLVEWTDTRTEFPGHKCIHELFEEQAAARPDSVALVFENQNLTYGELNRRANQLAHHLRTLGVRHDTLVGLCVERSLEMVVGLLGILKAGGAYLPLDPAYPQRRLAYMLADTGAHVILIQERVIERLPEHRAQLVCLDADWPTIARNHEYNPVNLTSPQNLAYCMYTSGSTGKPKGIATEHRSVVNLVTCDSFARMSADQCFLQAAPLCFDASTFELWGSLLHGARLILLNAGNVSFGALGLAIERHRVTVLWLTAALFARFCETNLAALHSLTQFLAGGDVLSPSSVRLVLDTLPNCRLINGYGPTECTTFAMCYSFPADFARTSAPLGRAIANTQIYILDNRLHPVPIGVAGEICIAGAGLARGYLNSADLTAASFVPNPFGDTGARMYRTGDRARYLPDGNVEFLGRTDNQIKIRGFRVEPGEVESALLRSGGISDVAVIPFDDGPFGKRLVAYIVAKQGVTLSPSELRVKLQRSLPEHMVPHCYVFIAELPVNSNGKIDRTSLPPPEPPPQALVRPAHQSPLTRDERLIADLWSEVLDQRIEDVDLNFFDAGGHSLAAMVLHRRLVQHLGRDFALVDLFRYPTVRALARYAVADFPADSVSVATKRGQQRRARLHRQRKDK